METNFTMIKKFMRGGFKPKAFGIISNDEVKVVQNALKIEGRDVMDLRNLRDMVVLYHMHYDDESMESFDRLSAVTAVIDEAIYDLGGEV